MKKFEGKLWAVLAVCCIFSGARGIYADNTETVTEVQKVVTVEVDKVEEPSVLDRLSVWWVNKQLSMPWSSESTEEEEEVSASLTRIDEVLPAEVGNADEVKSAAVSPTVIMETSEVLPSSSVKTLKPSTTTTSTDSGLLRASSSIRSATITREEDALLLQAGVAVSIMQDKLVQMQRDKEAFCLDTR